MAAEQVVRGARTEGAEGGQEERHAREDADHLHREARQRRSGQRLHPAQHRPADAHQVRRLQAGTPKPLRCCTQADSPSADVARGTEWQENTGILKRRKTTGFEKP